MKKVEFDKYAEDYDEILSESIPGNEDDEYFAEYKIAIIASTLACKGSMRILDFGCGSGRGLPYIKKYFPDSEIWGYDVSVDSLNVAKSRNIATRLVSEMDDVLNNDFNVIVAANVFHHIPVSERGGVMRKCFSALSDAGSMFIFEHNPYNPVTRMIFERCPFDVDAEMLSMGLTKSISHQAGFHVESCGYTLFFPSLLSFLRRYEPFLKYIPLGAQYYVQLKK